MDSVSRLSAVLVLALAGLLLPTLAHAEGAVPAGPASCSGAGDPNPGRQPQAGYTGEGWTWARVMHPNVVGGTCDWGFDAWNPAYSWANPFWTPTDVVYPTGSCPSNSTLNQLGTCTCATGYAPGAGAWAGMCVPPTDCEPQRGVKINEGWYDIGADIVVYPSATCHGGCAFVYSGNAPAQTAMVNGVKHFFAQAVYVGTGARCLSSGDDPSGLPPTPEPLPEPPPDTCPSGKVPTSVNGVKTCVPAPTPTDPPASSPTGPGNPTPTPTPIPQEPPASSPGGGSGGGGTGTPGGGGGEGEEGESSFSGSCAATSCTGDAIQCAMAREQARRMCEVLDPTMASARGLAAAEAGDQPGDHPRNSVTSVSLAGGFDKTSSISSACPAPITVPVGGSSATISFASLCGAASWLSNLLVGLTGLACLGIVFSTKGGSA